MILSLEIDSSKKLDVYSFFAVENAVQCPADLWFECICTSLRRKHSVLILESKSDVKPVWNATKRWDAGENWSWLAPRALSIILKAYEQKLINYNHLKDFLVTSK